MLKIIAIIILSVIFCARELVGQTALRSNKTKVGVALSGGSARGFAHIGVLRVLREAGIPIDRISGTSMGAVIGGLYAIGYSVDDLRKIAVETDWDDMLNDDVSRRYLAIEEKAWDSRYIGSVYLNEGKLQLPSGLVAGQKIATFLTKLTYGMHHIDDFTTLPIPFVCVATDIVTGKAVDLKSGNLSQAMRASMAIPTIFSPVKIGERQFVDGLIVRNLPAQEVKDLGADIVIGVDVSSALLEPNQINSFLDIIDQSISFQAVNSTEEQRKLCDVLIQPEFGTLTNSDMDKAEEMISCGENAARKMLPRIEMIMDSLGIARVKKESQQRPTIDSIKVVSVKVQGILKTSEKILRAKLDLNPPVKISQKDLDDAINRVYALQYFERVTYQLISSENGVDLNIRVFEKKTDAVRFGFRYDTDDKAAILVNLTLRNKWSHGSVFRLDVKLGRDFSTIGNYTIITPLPGYLGALLQGEYSTLTTNVRTNEQQADYDIHLLRGDLLVGSIFSTRFIAGAGLRAESILIDEVVGAPMPALKREKFYALTASVATDTYDKTIFPSKGQSVSFRMDYADTRIHSGAEFVRQQINGSFFVPLNRQFSVNWGFRLYGIQGDHIPPGYQAVLGGNETFVGLNQFEEVGNYYKVAFLGLRCEPVAKRCIIPRFNVGKVSDDWAEFKKISHPLYGYGLTLGAETFLGPLEVTASNSRRHAFLVYFSVGYKF